MSDRALQLRPAPSYELGRLRCSQLKLSASCRSDRQMFHPSFRVFTFHNPPCAGRGIICYVSKDTDASHLQPGWGGQNSGGLEHNRNTAHAQSEESHRSPALLIATGAEGIISPRGAP